MRDARQRIGISRELFSRSHFQRSAIAMSDVDGSIIIQETISIRNKDEPTAWFPTVVIVEGRRFVALDPYKDMGFTRFVWGNVKRWRRCTALSDLKEKRNEAVKNAALTEAGDAPDDENAEFRRNSSYKKRLVNKRVGELVDKYMEERATIAVDFPDGPEILFRLTNSRDPVCVELTSETLAYVQSTCRETVIEEKRRAAVPSPAKGIYWHKHAMGFLVDNKRANVPLGQLTPQKKCKFFHGEEQSDTALRYKEEGAQGPDVDED